MERSSTDLDGPFSANSSRLPEDTVFYTIFPDSVLSADLSSLTTQLQTIHLQILETLAPLTADYIWQHEPFTLSLSSFPTPNCLCGSHFAHFHGKVHYGDNIDDEWFVVFLLFRISLCFPNLSIRVWDNDGQFLLIEAAYRLPAWTSTELCNNRVFIRGNNVHIVSKEVCTCIPTVDDALKFLSDNTRASNSVQSVIKKRISEYPERALRNLHRVRVRVPVSVAQVLKHEPCLISLAVEGFYDRDIDTMKYAAKLEKFLSGGSGEDLVLVSVWMSRVMYAQLVQQTFQAPKGYPMPPRTDQAAYVEAELGMKIVCGFEMMYQQRKKEGEEGNGSTWEAFKASLVSRHFLGQMPGSKEYNRLMAEAMEYYRKSSLYQRASEMITAPVRRIDEILTLPHSVEDFKNQEVPKSDDDSWLYTGEDELNSVLMERQKEMELYEQKRNRKKKGKEGDGNGTFSSTNRDDFDLGDIAKSMQAFVDKVSSYQGAEIPEDPETRNLKDVDFDVDRYLKEMKSALRPPACGDGAGDVDIEELSSSDMDFDDSEDGSDNIAEHPENEDEEGFMHTYTNVLSEELKATTLKGSFVRSNDHPSNKAEGTSNVEEDMDEDFSPVDVDMNLVKSFLESFSSQQGLPGPASNLLGLMGMKLPRDAAAATTTTAAKDQ
ncbi:hypothetical protein Nepgr_016511 [Nepenthes gracilis]|uniref:Uncharacterized protein n=1 Tax=Nepenthes gracilis TaxID=150966 RepID=A0AAD3XSK3_NEPGR|nr:hypothetical protein Nepgr_016511 [Nepenthes gracilis]